MVDLLRRQIVPACLSYSKGIAEGVAVKASIGIDALAERELAAELTAHIADLLQAQKGIEAALQKVPTGEVDEIAFYFHDSVLPAMEIARQHADTLETLVGEEYWPLPSYRKMLFYI